MGLGYHVVEALIREHNYRPITGNVILIGRQAVYLTPQDILALLREHGVDVGAVTAAQIEIDRHTTNRFLDYANQDLISDSALFRLLGVPKVLALDHSDYENAELIHDLTTPIPPALRGCADFIVDGSTLDNVFDPAMVISNFAEMLRPGGRLLTTNVYSNDFEPYVIIPPLWFLDYFVVNGFVDCKIYIVIFPKVGPQDAFTINLDTLLHPTARVGAFTAPGVMATIVMAEKGADSTSTIRPSQQHYRSTQDWQQYRANLKAIMKSQRPHLVRTRGDITFFDVVGGHLFMANDFTARDPMTEILKLQRAATKALPITAGESPGARAHSANI